MLRNLVRASFLHPRARCPQPMWKAKFGQKFAPPITVKRTEKPRFRGFSSSRAGFEPATCGLCDLTFEAEHAGVADVRECRLSLQARFEPATRVLRRRVLALLGVEPRARVAAWAKSANPTLMMSARRSARPVASPWGSSLARTERPAMSASSADSPTRGPRPAS